MFDLLKENIKFHIKKRIERGHGSWGFIFPAMLVLVLVLWTLRITVITMEYQTTSGAEQSATETDGEAADVDGLDGETVMLAAETDAMSETNSQTENSNGGAVLAAAASEDDTTEAGSDAAEESSSESSDTGNTSLESGSESSDTGNISLQSSASTEGAMLTNSYEETLSYTASDVTYDDTTGDFDVYLRVNFEFNTNAEGSDYYISTYDTSIVTDTDYTIPYRIQLPENVIVPSALIRDGAHNGYLATDTQTIVFKYYFDTEEVNGETVYYIYLVFKDENTLSGYVEYSGSFSSEAYETSSESIRIYDSTTQTLLIEVKDEDITYSGNTTMSEDISVVKSGSYDSSTNTVTYTITVFSEKGTGDTIDLTDYFTDSGFADILGDLTGVSLSTTTVTYTTYNGENYGVTAETTTSSTELQTGDSSSTAPYYYTDDADGTLHIVLKMLGEYTGGGSYGSTTKTANAYVITYTYSVDPDAQVTYVSTNSVTATTEYDTSGSTISDTAAATVYATGATVLSKNGSYNSTEGTVTWTLTVGDGTSSLKDYVLRDEMLGSLAADDIVVKDASGNTLSADNICYAAAATDADGTVTYTYYSDAGMTTEVTDISKYALIYVLDPNATDASGRYVVSAILFNSDTGARYTITYTTSAGGSWTTQSVSNTATLDYEGSEAGEEGKSYTSNYSMYVTGSGVNAFTKSLDSDPVTESTDSNGDTVLTLSWTSTFTVPSTGIPAGTVFTDYATSQSGSGLHHITYEQAKAIIDALNNAWGSENISIEFCTNSNAWSTSASDWVSSATLDTSGSTKYYQFRFTLLNDIAQDTSAASGSVISATDGNGGTTYSASTVTYTYSTTAETTGYDTNIYYNTLTDGSNSKSASYTWYDKVAKYGTDTYGNISTGDSSITTSVDDDGNVTVAWVVRLVVESGTTYTVTDTLPEDVKLTALQVSKSGNYSYSDIVITDSNAQGNSGISTTVDGVGTFAYTEDTWSATNTEGVTSTTGQKAVLNISDVASGVSMLYLKYTCTYAAGTEAAGNSYALTNHVSVATESSTDYGDASQTTTVTIPETTTTTSDLTKTSVFDGTNNVLIYTVDINPDGKTYTDSSGEAYGDLTVTDTLSYSTYPGMGMMRSATLITSSLKLTDADTGEELDLSEYSWTYSESSTLIEWALATYGEAYQEVRTITLTIPNSRHLKLTYEYSFTIIQDGNWTEYNTNATNKATLSAESETIYETPSLADASTLSEVLTYGAANSGSVGYTIYKVDADNFSTKLSGAIFTLYVYDATSRNFIAAGNFTTGSSGSATILGTPNFDSNGKLAAYSVEVSGQEPVTIPLNTMCFIVETTAPEDYQLDDTKYYFYYGESISSSASDCDGYSSAASDAKNMVLSWSNYITNEHSSDYYAAKTSISVLKKWFDSNGEEYEKADGSITFALYRVLRLTDGTITSAAEADSGSSSGSSGSAGSSGSYLTWQLRYNNYTSYVTYAEGKTEITAGQENTVYFSVYYTGSSQWWYTPLTLYLVTDNGTETLATAGGSGTWSSSIANSDIVKEVSYSDQTYTFTLNVTDSIEIRCDASDVYSWSLSSYVLSATAATETSDSGGKADEPDSGSSSGTAATGDVYRLNFSDLADDDDFTVDQTTGADKAINGKYGWLSGDTPVSPDGSDGFFTVYGNLSISHGTASWDVDGDGIVDTDKGEDALKVCLKMESGAGTKISFTSEKGGYLTMVFNSQGNGNSVTLTDGNGNVSVLTPNNTTVSIYQYLKAGTYTITYNKSCYLFYMDFEEGAEQAEEDGNAYIHDFDDGLTSSFYAISGSLSYNYGTVSYDDIIASQCLKMSSSASITFTSTEAGTIYLILTNPKGASKVGVTLDGEEVYATSTQSADSQGYRIYTIMQRVEAGTHTIKRINGTEVMLYYIAYMADDYGGNVWGTNNETSALKNLTTEEQEAYERYAELVDTITISASTDWAWYSSKLASEYVDTETGVVKGEYLYYLVETKVNGETDYSNTYTVTYLNDDGIEYGSIGISNTIQKNTDEDTEITIAKSWVDATGADVSETYGATGALISYSLYSMMNLYDTATAEDLTSGKSIESAFTSFEQVNDFYTLVYNDSASSPSKNGGTVAYGSNTYESGLKINSGTRVSFDAPATNGTLMLVFSAKNKGNGDDAAVLSYGPRFQITLPDETSKSYYYNAEKGKLMTGNGSSEGSVVDTTTDQYIQSYSYSASQNYLEVVLKLESSGTYTISKAGGECYLYYIKYSYQYCYLVDGILTQEGTITPDTGSSWSKTIASLPKYIYNDAGDEKIGEYSYYVKETGVTIMIDGEAQELTPDSSGEYYSYSYTDDEGTTYTVKSAVTLTNGTTTSDEVDIAKNTITAGTLSIVNTVSVSTASQQEQDEYVLPATGGTGTIPGYAAGILLLIASAIIVFRRNKWQGCE